MPTFSPGDRFHHFTVGRLLGRGFHSEVHEITHPHTGDRFALKTMHLSNVGDARMVRRALAEAKGTYSIDHANVVKVLDLNCEENGLVWMRAELLAGETLAELLGRLGYLSPLFAISTAIEAAHGLQAAHEAQIIHRDVKPANLFYVRVAPSIKVIDFSIAKIFPEGLQTTMGRAGMGTPAFMAPEQLEGAFPTPAFDVYALGMTLWQMLAGRHPFHDVLNHSRELFRKQFSEMPPLLSDVARLPAEIDHVVRRAVAKDPVTRFHTMRDMAQALTDLRAFLEREASAGRVVLRAPPGEPPAPGDARSRRNYTPPTAMPRAEEPEPPPPARVVVSQPTLRDWPAPAGLGGTVPLGARGGLGGTVPLGRADMRTRAERATDVLPPLPASSPTPEPAVPATAAPATDMPTTVLSPARVRAAHRVPWSIVVITIALASLASIGLVVWQYARRPPTAPAPAVMPAPPSLPALQPPETQAPTPEPEAPPAPPPTSTPIDELTVHSATPPAPERPASAPATPRRPAPPAVTRPPPMPASSAVADSPPMPAAPPLSPRAPARAFDVDN
ncbi:MAG: serine/threonine-protein kinase [Minicystis sp.]